MVVSLLSDGLYTNRSGEVDFQTPPIRRHRHTLPTFSSSPLLNHTTKMALAPCEKQHETDHLPQAAKFGKMTPRDRTMLALGIIFARLGIDASASAEEGKHPDNIGVVQNGRALVETTTKDPESTLADNPYSTDHKTIIDATLYNAVKTNGRWEYIKFASGKVLIKTNYPSKNLAKLTFTQYGSAKPNLKFCIKQDTENGYIYSKKMKRFTFNCVNNVNTTGEVESFSIIPKSDENIAKFGRYFDSKFKG
ncbi:unnamed protein product [Cylindrotheca closterium]|uniref:Uncharacterized protein n=1 Tax=Cylindrotheca closterium TaxID=2856 RepID=A0AAD2PX37_9STRA|nr:unnamed protein product [Cylindrotheca closterium]